MWHQQRMAALDFESSDKNPATARIVSCALIVVGVLAIGVPALWWQIRAAAREESRQEQFVREECTPGLDVWDDHANRWITLPPGVKPSPGQYTDREVASLDQLQLAWDEPAYDPASDPQWAAGRERLFDAIRDERQKGEQA